MSRSSSNSKQYCCDRTISQPGRNASSHDDGGSRFKHWLNRGEMSNPLTAATIATGLRRHRPHPTSLMYVHVHKGEYWSSSLLPFCCAVRGVDLWALLGFWFSAFWNKTHLVNELYFGRDGTSTIIDGIDVFRKRPRSAFRIFYRSLKFQKVFLEAIIKYKSKQKLQLAILVIYAICRLFIFFKCYDNF